MKIQEPETSPISQTVTVSHLIQSLLIAAAFVGLATISQPVFAEQRTLRLGYLLDLSAKGSFIGKQSQAGARLAARELSTSGINVLITFEDHQTVAKNGVTGARKLIDVDSVEALMCDLTPPCIAAAPIVAAADMLFIYQAPIMSIVKSNKYAFKNFLDYEEGCRKLALHWKTNGLDRISHFKVNAEFGELCLKGAKDVFPNQQIYEYDAGGDLRSLLPRVKSFMPQAILQTGYESDYLNRLRASADIGLLPPSGMPQPLLTKNVSQSLSPDILNGTVVFGFPAIAPSFIARLKESGLYSSEVAVESAAIAYLHVKQLAASLLACPKNDRKCQASNFQASPADETLGFEGWKNNSAVYNYTLREWHNGTFRELPDVKS